MTSKRVQLSRLQFEKGKVENRLGEAHKKVGSGLRWVLRMKEIHAPDLSGHIDLSTLPDGAEREQALEQFLEKLGRNICCAECRTPWPCKTLTNVRHLHSALYYGDEVDLLLTASREPENDIRVSL